MPVWNYFVNSFYSVGGLGKGGNEPWAGEGAKRGKRKVGRGEGRRGPVAEKGGTGGRGLGKNGKGDGAGWKGGTGGKGLGKNGKRNGAGGKGGTGGRGLGKNGKGNGAGVKGGKGLDEKGNWEEMGKQRRRRYKHWRPRTSRYFWTSWLSFV
jgi:hypothetical protein